jgi:hypothetical protein
MKDDNEKNLTLKRWIIYFIVIIILLSLVLSLLLFDREIFNKGFLDSLGIELVSSFVAILILGWGYQIYTENEFNKKIKKDIITTIQLNEGNLLKAFTNTQKQLFIQENLNSIIGEKYGSYLFNGLLKKYVDQNVSYREDFNYNVDIDLYPPKYSLKCLNAIDLTKYYKCHQRIQYEKHFNKGENTFVFKIVFVFDEKNLDEWMNDNNVFVREILNFTDIENAYETLSSNLGNFFFDDLKLKISFLKDNSKSEFTRDKVLIKSIPKGIELSISQKEIIEYIKEDSTGAYYACRVEYCIPYSIDFKRFHFVLPEPTTNPTFTIRFCDQIKEIKHVQYLTNNSCGFSIESLENNSYIVKSSETTYPRSGMVFFWS